MIGLPESIASHWVSLRSLNFAESDYAWLLLLIPLIWLLARNRSRGLGHSNLTLHKSLHGSLLIVHAPTMLISLAMASLILILMQPQLPQSHQRELRQSHDWMLWVDISGSMKELLPAGSRLPAASAGTTAASNHSPQNVLPSKIQAAQAALAGFIAQREKTKAGDRIGLGRFDDAAYTTSLLSDDLRLAKAQVFDFERYEGGGTEVANENGPIAYGIQHFVERDNTGDNRPSGAPGTAGIVQLKRVRVLILITDGEVSMPEKRVEILRKELKKNGVILYVLGVGESFVNKSTATEPLRNFVRSLGAPNALIPVGDAAAMQKAVSRIDGMQRSSVEHQLAVNNIDYPEPFIYAALAFLTGYFLLALLTRAQAF